MNSNFDYNADFLSGESPESGAADLGGVITLSKKGDNSLFVDEDSGLGMETDMVGATSLSPVARFLRFHENLDGSYNEIMPSSPVCRRGTKHGGVRRGLLSRKRLAESQEVDDLFSPSVKKMKDFQLSPLVFKHDLSDAIGDMDSVFGDIIHAVDRCIQDDADLAECPNYVIKECPDDVRLPTIPGKHGDLKSISPSTLAEIVRGRYGGLKHMKIVDCRYPYEFEGGHVKGAQNLYTREAVSKLLADRPAILVFHCEFSSHRAPRMSRFLRNEDRELNKDRYPELKYPDMYLVDGGYKAFFEQYPDLCVPAVYKPMLHKDHAADLRHFRVKSKSWPQGKPDKKPLRLTRSRLAF